MGKNDVMTGATLNARGRERRDASPWEVGTVACAISSTFAH